MTAFPDFESSLLRAYTDELERRGAQLAKEAAEKIAMQLNREAIEMAAQIAGKVRIQQDPLNGREITVRITF